MENEASIPTGEKLLATLIELYADQMGVKIDYRITGEDEKEWELSQ